MLVAVISDIHANYPALQSVLGEIDTLSADLIVCAGDLVGYGPHPNQVVKALVERNIQSVRGDFDQAVIRGGIPSSSEVPYRVRLLKEKSLSWTLDALEPSAGSYLAELSKTMSFSARGRHVFVAHASPRSMSSGIPEDRPSATLRRLFGQTQAHVIILGHTHTPFHRTVEGRHLVNPGSVGFPLDRDRRASFSLIEFNDRVEVHMYRVEYDVEATVRDMREAGLPDALISGLASGWI